MRIIARQLIVIAAIVLSGGGAGIALGDFAAQPGPSRSSGVDESSMPAPGFDDPLSQDVAAPSASLTPAGPTSYSCEGCDAGRHGDIVAEDAADGAPLSPYRPEEGIVPEQPVHQAAAPPRLAVPRIMLPESPPARGVTAGQKIPPTAAESARVEAWR